MYLYILVCKIEWWIIRKLGLKKFKSIGKKTEIHFGIYSDSQEISIGDYVYIGEGAIFHGGGGIVIQSGTIIGPNVLIRSTNHPYKGQEFIPYGFGVEKRKVFIGENCWIGEKVVIVPGAIIGEGCIIGMGSVISGEIPNFSIVVGNPGKVIKTRDVNLYEKAKQGDKIYLKHKTLK